MVGLTTKAWATFNPVDWSGDKAVLFTLKKVSDNGFLIKEEPAPAINEFELSLKGVWDNAIDDTSKVLPKGCRSPVAAIAGAIILNPWPQAIPVEDSTDPSLAFRSSMKRVAASRWLEWNSVDFGITGLPHPNKWATSCSSISLQFRAS